ncbi:MAG: hypothetical protein JXA99_16175 [Candidatus Lokiarchaeota archaeon]|nr:hypothetical protein [Candidatus Lokiarchaeota archaeon]
MTTENSKYIEYFLNEDYLKNQKEAWEERFGPQVNNFSYTFVVHVIPDKEKKDIEREFYVVFELSYGKLKYNIVYDTKPKKLNIGWIWSGTPEKWKLAFKEGQFSPLKKSLKISQFRNLNMNAIVQLNSRFFGHLFAYARDFGYIEGESLERASQETKVDSVQQKEPIQKKDPELIKQEIQNIISKINNEGWKPDLGRQLGYCYFDLGNLEKAEEEFFKYLSETKNNDIPAFIFMKWASENTEAMNLLMSKSGAKDVNIANFSPDDMKQMYEDAKKNYLKRFEN